ncbi:MAG: hypothetical protein AABY00_00865 [Nanoarchaeota archaeon]
MKKKLTVLFNTALLAGALTGCVNSSLESSRFVPLSPSSTSLSQADEKENFFDIYEGLELFPPMTIGHAVLRMEKPLGAVRTDYTSLDGILSTSLKKISPQNQYSYQDATNILFTIHSTIRDAGYKAEPCVFLHKGIQSRTLDCDLGSYIYLSIADTLNIPLRAVSLPHHMFVRWNFPDGSKINWETTCGAELSDVYYQTNVFPKIKKDFPVEKDLEFKLTELDRNDLAAYAANFIYGNVMERFAIENPANSTFNAAYTSEEYTQIVAPIFSMAADYLLGYHQSYPSLSRAQLLEKAERYPEAIVDYTDLIEHNPCDTDMLVKRASAYARQAACTANREERQKLIDLANIDLSVANAPSRYIDKLLSSP